MKSILLSTLLLGGMALAQDASEKNIALKVGTLGVGIDVSTQMSENVGLRFNLNGASYNRTETVDNVNYDGTLKLLTVGALLDYYPSANNFRFTAGAYLNNNKLDLVAKPALTERLNIGDKVYTGAELGQLNSNITFNKIAPYVGLGWGNKASSQKGWGFTFDLGAMYQGSATATATPTINNALPQILKNEIVREVEKERQKIENDMGSYTWYPVIMVGVNYTF